MHWQCFRIEPDNDDRSFISFRSSALFFYSITFFHSVIFFMSFWYKYQTATRTSSPPRKSSINTLNFKNNTHSYFVSYEILKRSSFCSLHAILSCVDFWFSVDCQFSFFRLYFWKLLCSLLCAAFIKKLRVWSFLFCLHNQ